MKRIKKIISVVVALVMSNCLVVNIAAMNDDTISVEEIPYYQTIGDQAFSILNQIICEESEKQVSEMQSFVGEYAGSVIDENGQLTIYSTDLGGATELIIDEMQLRGLTSEAVRFVEVEYSHAELKSFLSAIWNMKQQYEVSSDVVLSSIANKITAASINPENNCVTVYVKEFTEDDEKVCAVLFDGYAYELNKNGEDVVIEEETTTMKIGQYINIRNKASDTKTYSGSIAVSCRLDGVKGILTCMHADEEAEGKLIYTGASSSDTQIGKVTKSVADGTADCAFIEITNSDYKMGWSTWTTPTYTLASNSYFVAYPIGSTVYMAGMQSSNVRVGKVIFDNFTLGTGDEWLVCQYKSAGGDSGGCVFSYINGDYCVMGIHNGSIPQGVVDENGNTLSDIKYVTKYEIVKEKIPGITLY